MAMDAEPSYTVGQVAGFAAVTVRALHHYDEIGLLSPSCRSPAGYRRYSAADLERLQQVLFYRELGFALDEIAAMVGEKAIDATEHLRRQHDLLIQKIGRLQAMAVAVEHALEAHRMGIQLTPDEQFEMFGDHFGKGYAAEAEQRWGEMPEYQESMKRAAQLTKEDWIRLNAEGDELNRRFASAMEAGLPADSETVMDLAEAHRVQIAQMSGSVTPALHRNITDLYVSDERFKATYDAVAQGLGTYIRDAAHANAKRAEDGGGS